MAEPLEILDVSALEPPEPLLRAVAALERLPRGKVLHMIHRIRPCLLYPEAERLGFEADTRQGPGGRCEVFLWRRDDPEAAKAARQAAATLPPWQE